MKNEIQRLRLEQVRCAKAANAAKTDAEREFAYLGVNDYFVEEMILMYWMELLNSGQPKCPVPSSPRPNR
jgi:hypothetical protein